MLIERIERFVVDSRAGSFEALGLEAFAFQYERVEPYRSLCDRQGRTPEDISRWQDVPLVPTLAFKTLELHADEPRETFRSSGTTSAERSVHLHPYPELYRTVIDASFPTEALPSPESDSQASVGRVPMLSLVPDRDLMPDSSLSFMIDHVVTRWGDPSSLCAIGPRGVDGRRLRAWLAARQRDGRPALILSTAVALLDALETLDRLGLRFRLPAGSVLFETGGYKGRTRELTREDLERRIEITLGLPADRIVREYGMTELTSQLYGGRLHRGQLDGGGLEDRLGDLFFAPHWVRIRVLDPQSLEPLPDGQVGMVVIFDLANVGSAIHLLTEDLGALEGGGLRLHGRALGADLRGCSLAAEELMAHDLEAGVETP